MGWKSKLIDMTDYDEKLCNYCKFREIRKRLIVKRYRFTSNIVWQTLLENKEHDLGYVLVYYFLTERCGVIKLEYSSNVRSHLWKKFHGDRITSIFLSICVIPFIILLALIADNRTNMHLVTKEKCIYCVHKFYLNVSARV